MKILFINPSLRDGVKGGHLFLPVGLGYVMTYVKKHGYNFDLLDIDAGGYDKHSKNQNTKERKVIVDRNTTTRETLNYATQEETMR